jgi:multidrug efflux pump
VKLSQVCIDRPVLAIVMSLVILLLGGIAMTRLPNREFPDIDPPVVSVNTVLPGAAPEVVETSVTSPLEDQLIGIEGIRHITSLSAEQVSTITIEFALSRDVDAAANDVRDRVARARRLLPEEVEEPVVAKQDADAFPILWIALFGGDKSQVELSTLAETRIKDRLGKLPGVSDVIIAGEQRYSMRVWVDNARLTAYRLTVADVAAALERGNVDIPSGRIEGADTEFTVRTLGELRTPEEYGALVVATVDGAQIRLRDVAEVKIGPEDERKIVRFNREPAVGLGVVKQSKANTLDVAEAVKAELARIEPTLPAGVRLEKAFDSSVFIERSLADVRQTILEAVALVVIVIWLFLRTFRATIVPTLAIPVSLVGTFFVLDMLGFTINTLTLMGMTLAIGIVVDDAIIVLENITRWIEEGAPPMEAARRGMDEIGFAVVAATISVLAVFLPLAFLSDKTGRLFREFGLTVATAVGISGFVALTLSPAVCARVLRAHRPEGGLKRLLARGFDALERAYGRLLAPALRHHRLVLLAGLAWAILGGVLLQAVPREFIPVDDRGAVRTFTRAPEGSTIEYTDRYQQMAEGIVLATPEVQKTFSVVALGRGYPGQVTEGAMFTTLLPWEERERSQQVIVDELRGRLASIPGFFAFPQNIPPLAQGQGNPISLVIQGPDVEALAGYANEIIARGREVPGVVNLQTDLLINKPQLELEIDRNRASDLGVQVRDVATTLQILIGGLDLSRFKLGGETYDVIVRLERGQRQNPRDLYRLYVRGRDGQLIPLASVARARETVVPRGLPHFDRLRAATITGALAAGVPLGEPLARMRAIAEEVLPEGQGYQVTFSGESEDFFESSNALAFAYALAVIIVFLVLAAQFDSFLHPLTIMVAVVLSFTGALLTLRLAGDTLNLFSQIGLVMLVGLVTKNSILIVEFANQLRAAGVELLAATREAAQKRFRPILMTAVSTIVGILPIALGAGAGGEARAPLGVAVAGGMLFSTLLTVFVVPAVYVAMEHLRSAASARRGAGGEADAPPGRVMPLPRERPPASSAARG